MDPARADATIRAGADAGAPARCGPGRRRVAAPAAGDRRRRRGPAAADARGAPRDRCPAMVVCGDRDPFVPVDHAWGIVRQLRDGRLFVAPDCGHEVMVRRPGLFNEAIAGFYRATEAEARRRAGEPDPGGRTASTPPRGRRRRPQPPRPDEEVR